MGKFKLSKMQKRVFYAIVGAFILFYVGIQVYMVNSVPVKTHMAILQNVYKSVTTDVFIIRDEECITGDTGKVMVGAVSDGQRVSKSNPIMYLFPDNQSAEKYARLQEIDSSIEYFHELMLSKNSSVISPDAVDKSIEKTVNDIQMLIQRGKYDEIDSSKRELLNEINQRQLITQTLTEEDLTAEIEALKKERESLGAAQYETLRAGEPGAFVSFVDGFENTADYKGVNSMKVADVQALFTAQPQKAENSIGKLIKEFDWYMVCVVDTLSVTDLKVGQSVNIDFPFTVQQTISATVDRMGSEDGGKSVLVLRCNLMDGGISALRNETAQIRIADYNGLRVDTGAVRTDENGDRGVYVLTGNCVTFKKIEIIYTDADYVLCEQKSKTEYLQLYDEVVIEGRGLYDGKIVR